MCLKCSSWKACIYTLRKTLLVKQISALYSTSYNFSATGTLSQVKCCVSLPEDKSSLLNSKLFHLLCLNVFCCDYSIVKYAKLVFMLNVTLISKVYVLYFASVKVSRVKS